MKAERYTSASGINDEYFRLFIKTFFPYESNMNQASAKAQIFVRNLKNVRVAAIIVLLTSCFWLIVDIKRGGTMNLTSAPALTAIIVQSAFSIYMFMLHKLGVEKIGKQVRYSFLAYYVCLLVCMTVLAVTKNVQMLEAGTAYSLAGVPLSSLFSIIFVLAPLPDKRDSLILGLVYIVTLFSPAFLPGHEIYNILQHIILGLCMIVAYWYVRDVNMALANSIERLSSMSFTDSLTGALNRRALDACWIDICENQMASTVGIIVIDIDDFKMYNDYYTHLRGDDALIDVCRTTVNVLDGEGSFLFRYGGEEFVILLLNRTDEQLVSCAQRIRQEVENANIRRDDDSIFDRITVTIGCAQETINKNYNPDYIINADKQLYIGKNNGKNCVVFNGEIL